MWRDMKIRREKGTGREGDGIRGSLEIDWRYKMYKQYEAPIRYGPSQARLNHEMRLYEFAVTLGKTVGLFTVFKPHTAAPKEPGTH
jgi:hypothetical protein